MVLLNEHSIDKVMKSTGMDRLQASRHVQQLETLATRPNPYPLGRNASIDHDAEYAAWAKRHPELAAAHA